MRRANRLDPASAKSQPLALKYVAARYADDYRTTANRGLFIGEAGYTWGRGVYVVGVEEPLSTAMYGRVGVVCTFGGARWRVFDARDPVKQTVFRDWLKVQPLFDDILLSVHSSPLLYTLRNAFRTEFDIDVVLFHPDESDVAGLYTTPADTWMAVSDWRRGELGSGYSRRFRDARTTVIVEEEFSVDDRALLRFPQLKVGGTGYVPALATSAVRTAYAAGAVVRVSS